MSTDLLTCERTAREEGLAAGLAAALAGVRVGDVAPGRYAAVPARDVPSGSAVVVRHRLADPEGIVFMECPGDRIPDASALARTGRLLAAVRLGVLRRTLDLAVEALSDRSSGGEPLLRKQLVTGAVADVMAGVELLRAYARSQSDPAAVGELHTRIDTLGWQVTTLFGAAGYVTDHPARALYVSALVAGSWTDREGNDG